MSADRQVKIFYIKYSDHLSLGYTQYSSVFDVWSGLPANLKNSSEIVELTIDEARKLRKDLRNAKLSQQSV